MRINLRRGFTLVELLVVVGIVSVLIGIVLPSFAGARRQARSVACLSQLRQIGVAVQMYCGESNGALPRSTHSAFEFRVAPWGYALMPYLSPGPIESSGPRWDALFAGVYRCPADERPPTRWSYGKNVYPELRQDETGGPTWWKMTDLRRPSRTVLFAEARTGSMSDHVMAHEWSAAAAPQDVDRARHGRSANYLFADGHAEPAAFEQTFDAARSVNLWNPATAR